MAKTKAKSAAAKGNGKPAAAAKKPRRAVAEAGSGARIMIMRMALKDPAMTSADMYEALKKKGSKVSKVTVSAMRSQFRQMVGVLQEAGKLSKSLEV